MTLDKYNNMIERAAGQNSMELTAEQQRGILDAVSGPTGLRSYAGAQLDELREANDSLRSQLEELKMANVKLQMQAEMANASLAELRVANSNLQAQLSELRTANDKLQTQVDTAEADGKDAKKQALISNLIAALSFGVSVASLVIAIVLG